MKPRLLIIEDDESLRTQMKWALAEPYELFMAGDRSTGLDVVRREQPAVVILDLGLPPKPDGVEEGFLSLSDILMEDSLLKVIVVTGQNEREHALRAIGQGAYDFLSKPVDLDELKIILRRAFHVSQLEHEHRELRKRLREDSFEGMLGTSPQIQRVFTSIRKVATTDESGRRERPFVAINCGAIPETLLESELFGHEKGAFTGAHVLRRGRIEKAQGGTLFLDEIGDLSPALQVKLLRFLQEHRIERLGGRDEIEVDSRVIAASNLDIEEAMREGRFREDLYYRLGVVVISMPPLREREGDIPVLAKVLFDRYIAENNKKLSGFTSQGHHALEAHSWPGNIRELENRVKRAVIMCEGTKITPEDLELDSSHVKYRGQKLKEARETLEKDLIQQALTRNKGNISRTATDLGVSRPTLYELMERLGIERR
jgi:two-component system NtrC family response regulator